ncbi:MAG: YbhB/YbcL family Raf kinase inhibitor-like protein [Phycisphaerales bacterium]|nr:YbhB/YbcL family Raf kinase inhibitor-like protein [Phycisphaerales bacterium]
MRRRWMNPEIQPQRASSRIMFGIVTAALCITACVDLPAAAQVSRPDTDGEIRRSLERIRSDHKLPALAAAVVCDDRILAADAVGTRRIGADDEVELGDRFHVGSCTKAITATMIATLVDEGKLSWETTIAEVLPDLKDQIDGKFARVTLEHLLTHRAGVPSFTAGSAPESTLTKDLVGSPRQQRLEFLKRVVAQNPLYEPGSKMVYSNGGYGLAAAIAEQVMDDTWENLIRQRAFEPLGMSSAGFGWPASQNSPNQPCGHWNMGGKVTAHWPNDNYTLPAALAPAGDVHCSIEDFARFAQFHLRGLCDANDDAGGVVPGDSPEPRAGKELSMKPQTFRRLHTPGLDGYAMGWVIIPRDGGETVSWHNGSAGTFFAWMTVKPKSNLAVVVVTNVGNAEPACEEATKALFDHFAEPAAPPAGPSQESGGNPMTLQLTSAAFKHQAEVPSKYTCDGQDVSPGLSWSPGPKGTQSYALIMDDPDAPMGTWVHWVAWNIAGTSLPEGIKADAKLPGEAVHGTNSWKKLGYGGPCPPSGTHRYFFRIYALDTKLSLKPSTIKQQLLDAMKGHILDQGELMGTYARKQ